jgi:histidine ammonia-lyase
MSKDPIILDGHNLTLGHVEAAARRGAAAQLDPGAHRRVQASAEDLQRLAHSEEPIYGVNTGFGVFADRRIDASQAARLSRNLILSHAVAVGPAFPSDVVRAAMLIRANTLAHGHSGVRPQVINTLLAMLRHEVTPYVPSQGSLGSSGDLAPMAHLALVLSTGLDGSEAEPSGQAWHAGRLMAGSEAMAAAGIPRLALGPKEGLALTNGATFSTAILALACVDAQRLLRVAEIGSAMALEALLGLSSALDDRLHRARPHPGQVAVAQRLRSLTHGSTLLDSTDRVQDAYSLRCTPQVIGPAWDILAFTRKTVTCEMNAATDNPLVFGHEALSGGTFHGEPIGLAADYLKIALTEVGALAERRAFRLITGATNAGLPPMLVSQPEEAGLQSGLMMLQYTAASLALENQGLASPDSVRSLPTSAGQEDHNANATSAAPGTAVPCSITRRRSSLDIELTKSRRTLST